MNEHYQAIFAIAQANINPAETLLQQTEALITLGTTLASLQQRLQKSVLLGVPQDAEYHFPAEYLRELKRYLDRYSGKYQDISELYRLHLIQYAYDQSPTQEVRDAVIGACKELVTAGVLMTNPQVLEALNMPAWKLNRWVLKGLIANIRVGHFRYYSAQLITELSEPAQLISAKDAAKYLKITPREVFVLDAKGVLTSTRDSSGKRHYKESDLKTYREKHDSISKLKSSGLGTAEAAQELGISLTNLQDHTDAGLIAATKVHENLIVYDREEIAWAKEGLNAYATEPEFEWLETYLEESGVEYATLNLQEVANLLGVRKDTVSDWRGDGLIPSRIPVLLAHLQNPPRLYVDVYFIRLKLYAGKRTISRSLLEEFRNACINRGCIVTDGMRYVINPEFEWLEAFFISSGATVSYLPYGQVQARLGIAAGALSNWRQKELIPYYKTDPPTTLRKKPALWYPDLYFEQLLNAAKGQRPTQDLVIKFRNECAERGQLPLA